MVRRSGRPVAVRAGLALLAAGLAGLGACSSAVPGDRGSRSAAAGSGPAPAVATPDLEREAGRGRAGVRVPESWGVGEVQCGTAVADTVWYSSADLVRACRVSTEEDVSSLRVGTARGVDTAGFVTEQVDGVEVLRSETSDGPVTVTEVVVPSQDAHFEVRSADPGLGERIGASLHLLDEDEVFVPDVITGSDVGIAGVSAAPTEAEVEQRLDLAGLRLEVQRLGSSAADRSAGWWPEVDSVRPRIGEVVPVGTVVRVGYRESTKQPHSRNTTATR